MRRTTDREHVLTLLQTFASVLQDKGLEHQRRLVAYPNSGEVWDAGVRDWKAHTAAGLDHFGEQARQWVADGASIIGGCCRTTPAHISMLVQALKKGGLSGSSLLKRPVLVPDQ